MRYIPHLTLIAKPFTLIVMVAFGHTAVGALIGLTAYNYLGSSNPYLGLAAAGSAGVISHYIFDCLPHGHFFREHKFKKNIWLVIIFDLFLSVAVYLVTAYQFSDFNALYTLYILFGIAGSQLPDIIDGLIYIGFLPNKGVLKLENDFHILTHWHGKREKALLWSKWDTWQILLFFIGLYILLTTKI